MVPSVEAISDRGKYKYSVGQERKTPVASSKMLACAHVIEGRFKIAPSVYSWCTESDLYDDCCHKHWTMYM